MGEKTSGSTAVCPLFSSQCVCGNQSSSELWNKPGSLLDAEALPERPWVSVAGGGPGRLCSHVHCVPRHL